jgi:hypothetical protein
VKRRALCSGMRRSALPRSVRLLVRGGVGAPVAFGQSTGIGKDDNRGAVIGGSRVGEVCLAENRRRGEVHANGRAERKGERAVCGRGWVKVCSVLETWAEGIPRHWGEWITRGR